MLTKAQCLVRRHGSPALLGQSCQNIPVFTQVSLAANEYDGGDRRDTSDFGAPVINGIEERRRFGDFVAKQKDISFSIGQGPRLADGMRS